MECGKLTAKLRDAVPIILIEDNREPIRFKNIELPDEIKHLVFRDFKFDVASDGTITFKIYFENGTLPMAMPEHRTRRQRYKAADRHPEPEPIDVPKLDFGSLSFTTFNPTPPEPDPEYDPEPEFYPEPEPLPDHIFESDTMDIRFNVPGTRRKDMVQAIAEYLNEKAKYMALPTKAYKIGDYEVDRFGTLIGKSNPDMIRALRAKGFEPEY